MAVNGWRHRFIYKGILRGLDAIPEIEPGTRENIQNNYLKYGISWLQNQVKSIDPAFWLRAEQQNPQRLIRALEVYMSTEVGN